MEALLYAGAGVATWQYYQHLKRQANKLLWEVRGSIYSVNLSGVKIRLDVTLKNPTTTDFSFTFPFLTLGLDDADVLASSQVSGAVVNLNGGSEKALDPIWITLPISSLLRLGLAFVNAVTEGKQGLKLIAKAHTNAQLFFGLVTHQLDPLRKEITVIKSQSG